VNEGIEGRKWMKVKEGNERRKEVNEGRKLEGRK
jgi:hypothetical protein